MRKNIPGELKHFRVLVVNVVVDAYICVAASADEAEERARSGKAQRDSEYTSPEPSAIAALTFDRANFTKVPEPVDIANEISRAWSGYMKFMQQRAAAEAAQMGDPNVGPPPK